MVLDLERFNLQSLVFLQQLLLYPLDYLVNDMIDMSSTSKSANAIDK